jgi:hypothetical protein
MKCERCGNSFPHLHTLDLVLDRDYGNLAAQLRVCVDCVDAIVDEAKKPAPAQADGPTA